MPLGQKTTCLQEQLWLQRVVRHAVPEVLFMDNESTSERVKKYFHFRDIDVANYTVEPAFVCDGVTLIYEQLEAVRHSTTTEHVTCSVSIQLRYYVA